MWHIHTFNLHGYRHEKEDSNTKLLEVVYLLYEKRYTKLSMKHNKDFLTNFCPWKQCTKYAQSSTLKQPFYVKSQGLVYKNHVFPHSDDAHQSWAISGNTAILGGKRGGRLSGTRSLNDVVMVTGMPCTQAAGLMMPNAWYYYPMSSNDGSHGVCVITYDPDELILTLYCCAQLKRGNYSLVKWTVTAYIVFVMFMSTFDRGINVPLF